MGDANHDRPSYDRWAGHYDHVMRPLERRLVARLRAEAVRELPAGARLVEIGAGTGANFSYYPPGAAVAATELSAEMLRRARLKGPPAGVALVQSPAERLPFADGAFDAALCTLVLCSVKSINAALSEMRRVVRAGGRVALVEHVRPPGLLGHVFDAVSLLTVPFLEDHFNRRTAEEAARAGLKVLRVESHALGVVQLIVCEV
ncbi:MAG TPA: methyltransferase domain-containing protein [Pyrinomonadaceae bacterium]|nr:methyltransferase domain-containing protein [Pyrinomonadaceae bacterium]